jgi:hypothetical protein
MTGTSWTAVAMLAASALAGCAGAPAIINYTHYYTVDEPGQLLPGGSDVPVLVYGAPFGGMPSEAFRDEVIDAMQGWGFNVPVRFVPASAAPPSVYRVVMVFDQDGYGPSVCASPATRLVPPPWTLPLPPAATVPPPPQQPPPTAAPAPAPAPGPVAAATGRIPLNAVFCRSDAAISYAYGSLPRTGDPTADAFRRGVGYFVIALFPARNPHNQNGSRRLAGQPD